MQAAAEIDQPAWTLDQRREHVRRERVDGEGAGMDLGCRSATLLRIDVARASDDMLLHAPSPQRPPSRLRRPRGPPQQIQDTDCMDTRAAANLTSMTDRYLGWRIIW